MSECNKIQNSIVTLEDIGEGDDALLCITDQRNCCTPAQIGTNVAYGNWFFPDMLMFPVQIAGGTFELGSEGGFLHS